MANKKLFLIDGNSFCYRAFYAIRSLNNSRGMPTNAVYGFVTMLNKIIKGEKPDYLGIAFDVKGPTFRHKKLKTYKITRKPMPDDLIMQMPVIKEVVKAYNIPIFEMEGYEADDILATIVKKVSAMPIDTSILTGDKDVMQLVGPHVKVVNTHKEGLVYDETKVKEKFGIGPESIADLMALMGDQSDNYKGVPGIGEVAACELIKDFGSIDNLYKNLSEVKREGWRKILEKHEADARISKELAILDSDVPIDVDLGAFALRDPDSDRLIELFRELEFKGFLKEFIPEQKWLASYKTVSSESDFEGLLKEIRGINEMALDFETTDSDSMLAELVGISFCWKEAEAYYVPLKHIKEKTLDTNYVLDKLKVVFEDEGLKKIGHNIKYEKVVLLNYGIDLKGMEFDTMVGSYLLNPSKMSHGLDDVALEYLGVKMAPITDLIGKGKNAVTMDHVDIEKVASYCCLDSDAALRLSGILKKKLSEHGLADLFYDIEMPLVDVLSLMEFHGVAIDVKLLEGMSADLEKSLQRHIKDIYEMCGFEFNINSPKQLSEVLYDKLNLPVIKRTKTGISTDEEVLRKLACEHALPSAILEYRELMKLKTTYVDNLPHLINPKTNKLHTSFNQAVTATGRLSSSQPNLQNIPIKREAGRKIRQAFVPSSEKRVLLSSDYSQIELRILAHLSGDKKLIDAFKRDLDIHTYTASLVNGVSQDKVTDKMRSQAKTVNFGIIYGMSAYGLSKSLEIDPAQAQEFIDAYFQRYPDVKLYLEDVIKEAREIGYVTTLMKRRRYIPDIQSENTRLRQFAERTAINAPIQGSAADLIKVAMVDIHGEFKTKRIKSTMILQVHDELVFDCLKTELKKVKKIVKDRMENVIKLKVPVKTNISIGTNWLDLKELE